MLYETYDGPLTDYESDDPGSANGCGDGPLVAIWPPLSPRRALLENVLNAPPIFVYDATFYCSEAVEGTHGILGTFRYDRDEGQTGRLVPPQRYAHLSHMR